jgi:CBS domain-containing protein/gamma-glutamyl:cysteine ligase YbdK (ATP-grasp superfamily)
MGEQQVTLVSDSTMMQNFIRHLLRDVEALRYMLENDWFETDTIRIGAEQEMFLVDSHTYKPAMIAMEALKKLGKHPWITTELAKFNLEINLTPRTFTGSCLSEMEAENAECLGIIRNHVAKLGSKVALTGILPTLRKFDLEMQNLTPKERYYALMEALNQQLIGSAYELRLSGIDELLVKHNSPLLEACNTSFQVHLQVTPQTFVPMYNIAQTLAAPIIAIGANSPIVFGKRLWHETRIALFQQSLDVRTTHEHMRERSPRVSFGTGWLDRSILEIYKEDIARFRVLLGADIEEDSLEDIQRGKAPRLRALQVHNSTVYRWNRACYGVSPNGKPHLRIENRVLPSGPTVVDSVANAAFWLGAMEGMAQYTDDIRKLISWEDVRDNFGKAAKFGIDSNFTWFKDRKISACDLIEKELLPLARQGLASRGVDSSDIDKYLGIIEERAKHHMNGARWQLRAFTKLQGEVGRDEALSVLTACIIKNQSENKPVHTWPMPNAHDLDEYRPSGLRVEEFMVTDLFTVHPEDIVDLVADLMDWRRISYMPVEDHKGRLIGLVTSRQLLRHYARRAKFGSGEEAGTAGQPIMVKDVMIKDPLTISPQATLVEAMRLMREKQVGCLPVVQDGELVGIITEMDYIRISARLLERLGE